MVPGTRAPTNWSAIKEWEKTFSLQVGEKLYLFEMKGTENICSYATERNRKNWNDLSFSSQLRIGTIKN